MLRSLPLSTHIHDPRVRPRLPLGAKGFRPFFLLAALFAVTSVPSWLLILLGALPASTYLDPPSWHAHEMVFGFATAVIAGFLLTAVGNWTQRETLIGSPLLALAALWACGRVAMAMAGRLPYGVGAAIDLAFLPLLGVALARPLIAAGNRRNFLLLGIVAALFAANLVVHLEGLRVLGPGAARRACLAGVDLVLVMISIVVGRVLPMFTRNATGVQSLRSRPPLDIACTGSMLVLTLAGVFAPQSGFVRVAAGLTAVLAVARAWHWGVQHAFRQPLLWILHAGYAWFVVGLVLRALPQANALASSLALHALTVGAIGSLTLGMMARVSLGHTGRALAASPATTLAFLAINVAAFVRAIVPLAAASWYATGLWVGGAFWTTAFGLYVSVYLPVLCSARVDAKPG